MNQAETGGGVQSTILLQTARLTSRFQYTPFKISFQGHKKQTAPNCIKDFLDLPRDSGQSGLTLQLFQIVILVNHV